MNRWTAYATISLALACGEDVRSNDVADDGKLCAGESASGSTSFDGVASRIEAGRPLSISVELNECLSHSCDTERRASCRVELDGRNILVTSRFEWNTRSSDCTDDCGALVARCDTPPLDAGNYRLRFGDAEELPITVPGELSSTCID